MVDRAEADAFVRAIGQVLRTERKRLGLTQAELGHRVVRIGPSSRAEPLCDVQIRIRHPAA